jgi:hypothetical protein
VVGFGGGDRELGEDRADVLLDRALAEDERLCDPRVRPPLRHQPEHLELPRGEDAERPTPGDELSHDLGVERGAALGDAAYGVEEVADVPDPLLQEIAHGAVTVGEKLGRVRLLHVLREHEHGKPRLASPCLDRRSQTLVAERRREPDVDDGDVGLRDDDRAQEIGAVVDGADDLVAPVLEQAHEALAQ